MILKRLDILLVEKLNITRSYGEFLITNNRVYVNGKLIKKKHQKFTMEHMIEIKKDTTLPPIISYLEVNNEYLIVNKPYGISCHRSATTPRDTYVLNELVARDYSLSEAITKEEFGLPHRIDRYTEGLLLMTRTKEFYEYALSAFNKGEFKKTYLCIVSWNKTLLEEDTIKLKLFYGNEKVLVKNDGVSSETHYEVLSKYKHYAVLKITPVTGRRHQIRVVLAHLGCPIVGDTIYAGEKFHRLCLFSSQLSCEKFNFSLYDNHLHDINNMLMELVF
jgi:23S rRNA pseudouridine1911/1915/1917 synthase